MTLLVSVMTPCVGYDTLCGLLHLVGVVTLCVVTPYVGYDTFFGL